MLISFVFNLTEAFFSEGFDIELVMNEQEFRSLLTTYITSQRHLLLMLEMLQNDKKRITHLPHDTRHRFMKSVLLHDP